MSGTPCDVPLPRKMNENDMLKFSFVAGFQPIQFNHGCTRINTDLKTRIARMIAKCVNVLPIRANSWSQRPAVFIRVHPCPSVVLKFTGTKSNDVNDATHQKPRARAGPDA
jgi:hypothetical protein